MDSVASSPAFDACGARMPMSTATVNVGCAALVRTSAGLSVGAAGQIALGPKPKATYLMRKGESILLHPPRQTSKLKPLRRQLPNEFSFVVMFDRDCITMFEKI